MFNILAETIIRNGISCLQGTYFLDGNKGDAVKFCF
jgi:hypothetical protein